MKKNKIIYSMFPWFWCAELFSSEQMIWSPFFFFIWCWAVAIKTFAGAVGFCFFLSSNYTELLLAEHGLAKRTSTDYDVKGFSNIFFGLRFFCWFFLWAEVILYSVLVYRKHQHLKTSFVEKLSRKSLAVCEALL